MGGGGGGGGGVGVKLVSCTVFHSKKTEPKNDPNSNKIKIIVEERIVERHTCFALFYANILALK